MSTDGDGRARAAERLARLVAGQPALRARGVREVSWEGPFQLVLRTAFEQRGVTLEREEVRSVGARSVPVDVAADLAVSNQPGEVVHRLEGPRIEELAMPAGYREGALPAQDLAEAAARLCQLHGVDPRARVLRQVLEVRRIHVAHLRLSDGTELWCWGDPPRIHPGNALDSTWFRAVRSPRVIALALAILAVVGGVIVATYAG